MTDKERWALVASSLEVLELALRVANASPFGMLDLKARRALDEFGRRRAELSEAILAEWDE